MKQGSLKKKTSSISARTTLTVYVLYVDSVHILPHRGCHWVIW